MYIRSSKSQEAYGRSESQSSSQTSTSVEICRICHCEGDAEGGLIAPCYCSGSLRYVHQTCLQQWIKSSNIRCCELCKFQFIMHTKTKPFMEVSVLYLSISYCVIIVLAFQSLEINVTYFHRLLCEI